MSSYPNELKVERMITFELCCSHRNSNVISVPLKAMQQSMLTATHDEHSRAILIGYMAEI